MQVAPIVAGEALPQPGEPVVVSEPTQEFSPELGLGTAASNATDVIDALTVGGLLDLIPGSGSRYVGVNGFEAPVCADEPVVDVVGVDRKLFDAANATKARTHFCWGRPGSLEGGEPGHHMGILGLAAGLCCVFPWTIHLLMFSPCLLLDILNNTLCSKHKDMEFPPWAGAALVMTDKGVIGRRHFGPDSKINAISWGGFDVDRNVRIDPYVSKCVNFRPRYCLPPLGRCVNLWPYFLHPLGTPEDSLVVGPDIGLLVPCCRCICIQPKEPGLYRATIFSKHTSDTTTVSTGGDSGEGGCVEIPTGSIELLALARSPEELRSSLRALKEKYLDSLPTTTVEHNFGVWCGRLGISTFRSDTGRAEVGSVKTCSKAESYGMQVGDTILELDGQSVDYDAFHAGLNAARRAKRSVQLLIARGG